MKLKFDFYLFSLRKIILKVSVSLGLKMLSLTVFHFMVRKVIDDQ